MNFPFFCIFGYMQNQSNRFLLCVFPVFYADIAWCCYMILQQLHSKTMLAHISAFPNKCTIKHPFHTKVILNVWICMKTTSFCSVWKKNKPFDNTILTQIHAWHITQNG